MGAFADYRSVISRVGWVEQVHGRGLQQFDGRVGCLQWPPFREGLADREADSSFSLPWWPLQQVDPSLPNYKTPTTQNMHMWALRGCMPVSPSIDPSQINHGYVVYGGQMQFEQTLRINISCEARLSKYQRKWRPVSSSHILDRLSWYPWSTHDPEGIEADEQPCGVTCCNWELGCSGSPSQRYPEAQCRCPAFQPFQLSPPYIFKFIYFWSVGRLRYCDIHHELDDEVATRATLVKWNCNMREVCTNQIRNRQPIGGVDHIVEIDESLFARRKLIPIPGQWVLGGIDRQTGECFLQVVQARDALTLIPIIQAWVLLGTIIMTDEWRAHRATAATLVHAFVLTRIDYCNALLVGTTKQQLNRLQMVLNTAARLLLRIPKFGHISSAIIHLTLVACARSPHLQDMLSRLEQCCGCWSVIPTWTLHLVVGRLGTSTAFFNRFAPEGALLPLCHNTATCLCGHRADILELNSSAALSAV